MTEPGGTAGGEERVGEEDFPAVSGTPFVEEYDWGLIGFQFYEGWMEDVRSCAAGLRDRLVKEDRKCNPAERLQKALISWHFDAHPVLPPEPPKAIDNEPLRIRRIIRRWGR